MKFKKFVKKLSVGLLAVAMMATTLTGCGEKKKDTFTVGFDAEYPPYGYMDENGEYLETKYSVLADLFIFSYNNCSCQRMWSLGWILNFQIRKNFTKELFLH